MHRISFLFFFLLVVPRYDCTPCVPCILALLEAVMFVGNKVSESRCNVAVSLTVNNNMNDHLYLVASGSNGNFEKLTAPGLIPAGGSAALQLISDPEFGALNDKQVALIFKYGSDKSFYLSFKVTNGVFAYTVQPNWDEDSQLTWWGPGNVGSQSNYHKLTDASAQFGIIVESIQQRWSYGKNQCVSGNVNIVLQGSTVRETRALSDWIPGEENAWVQAAEALNALVAIADLVIPEGLFSSPPTQVFIALNNGNNKDMACTYSRARNRNTKVLSDKLSISGYPYVKSGQSVAALAVIFESSEDEAEICYRVDGKTGWGTCIQVQQTGTTLKLVVYPDFVSYDYGFVGYAFAEGDSFQETVLFDKVRGNTGIGGFVTFSGTYTPGATLNLDITFYDIARGFTVDTVDVANQQLRRTLQRPSSNSSNHPANHMLEGSLSFGDATI